MGRRDRERIARVSTGAEPLTRHTGQARRMVQCKYCRTVMPDYRIIGHMEEEHPQMKTRRAPRTLLAMPTVKEAMRYGIKKKA